MNNAHRIANERLHERLRGKKRLRAAIIGTGRIADLYDEETVHLPGIELPPGVVHANMYGVKPVAHAGAYHTLPGYELVAAANRGEERLHEFGARHGVQSLYTDYCKMLSEENPDVVSICTQSPDKCEVVLACAAAGVPAVIVEKAFATSLQEADAMLAACERSGTFISVNHPMRFSLMFRRVKEIVDTGLIGKLGTVTCYTGGLVHGGTHDMDFMCYLAGNPTSVFATIPDLEPASGDPFGATYPDLRGNAVITFANGTSGFFSGLSPTSGGADVRGTEGYVTPCLGAQASSTWCKPGGGRLPNTATRPGRTKGLFGLSNGRKRFRRGPRAPPPIPPAPPSCTSENCTRR